MPNAEPTPSQIVAALRGAGLTVVEMPGWRGRCRCHSGPHDAGGPTIRSWTGPEGVTWHHTAGPMLSGQAALDYTTRILIGGNGVTPGPLCLAGIDADGRWLMTGAGRCNHIGSISSAAATAIKRGTWQTSGGSQNLRGRGIDGNTFTWGLEALAPGDPNPVQRQAMVAGTAALNRLLGISAGSTHGHGEASDQRGFSDPGFDMSQVRRDVAAAMGGLVAGVSTTPAPTREDIMTPEQEAKLDRLLAIETETQQRVTRAAQDAAEARALAKTAVDIATETQRRLGWQAKDTSVSEQIGTAAKAPVVTIEPSTIAAAIVELAKGH